MADNRYFRMNCSWRRSRWVRELPEGAQLCWVILLGYVKSEGIRGRVKALDPEGFAYDFRVSRESAEVMIRAALEDGAIVETDSIWEVVNWADHQSDDDTTAERSKRYRERQKAAKQTGEPVTQGRDDTTVTRDDTAITQKERITIREQDGNPPKPSLPPTVEEVCDYGECIGISRESCLRFHERNASVGWVTPNGQPIVDWQALLKGPWLRKERKIEAERAQAPPASEPVRIRPGTPEWDAMVAEVNR